MNSRDKDLWNMAAENLSNSNQLPELDLHGLAVHVAVVELESFLNTQFMAGQEAVKVVCGIGTGKVLEVARKILKEYQQHGLVEGFTQTDFGGVFIVRLNEKD